MLNPYTIAKMTDCKKGVDNIKAINQLFRFQDESHLWPICNRFNATERAIRQLRVIRKDCPMYGLEYVLALDAEISRIVNN